MQYLEGILKIANFVLALIAGFLAVSFLRQLSGKEHKSWKILMFALLFFGVQMILGAFRAFGIFSTPHLTHVVPSIILGLIIWALSNQIHAGERS